MPRKAKVKTITEAMEESEVSETETNNKQVFDFTQYQVTGAPQKETVVIEETGDSFDVTVKPLSWSRRNQILATSITWDGDGNTAFNGDIYVRSCLKEMIVDAPWGRTTEAFLISIDSRLGTALENVVPKAFSNSVEEAADAVKKE